MAFLNEGYLRRSDQRGSLTGFKPQASATATINRTRSKQEARTVDGLGKLCCRMHAPQHDVWGSPRALVRMDGWMRRNFAHFFFVRMEAEVSRAHKGQPWRLLSLPTAPLLLSALPRGSLLCSSRFQARVEGSSSNVGRKLFCKVERNVCVALIDSI